HEVDQPKIAPVDERSGSDEARVEAALEADLKRDARVIDGFDGTVRIGQRVSKRLFAEDAFAGLRRGDDRVNMKGGWRGDDHRLHLRFGEQPLDFASPELTAERGSRSFGHARLGIGEADEAGAGDASGKVGGVVGADQPDANDAKTDGLRCEIQRSAGIRWQS